MTFSRAFPASELTSALGGRQIQARVLASPGPTLGAGFSVGPWPRFGPSLAAPREASCCFTPTGYRNGSVRCVAASSDVRYRKSEISGAEVELEPTNP